ncbi:hypothetical protein DFH09DRAFT_1089144 [Mycena vulgaris]|nr:hypothetical protein DFH09DRAFT_1089144 [Mycena vulgaris]
MRLISVIYVSASLVLASFAAPVNHPSDIAQAHLVHSIPLLFSPCNPIPIKGPDKSLSAAGSDLFNALDLTARVGTLAVVSLHEGLKRAQQRGTAKSEYYIGIQEVSDSLAEHTINSTCSKGTFHIRLFMSRTSALSHTATTSCDASTGSLGRIWPDKTHPAAPELFANHLATRITATS